jgi:hypothetical protein
MTLTLPLWACTAIRLFAARLLVQRSEVGSSKESTTSSSQPLKKILRAFGPGALFSLQLSGPIRYHVQRKGASVGRGASNKALAVLGSEVKKCVHAAADKRVAEERVHSLY